MKFDIWEKMKYMNLRKIIAQLLIMLSFVPAIHAADFQKIQLKGPKNGSEQFSGTLYGPIDSLDTLWQISKRYRQNEALSIYQVMQAIYELNPDAFEQQNINLLKNGSILKLPNERYISRVSNQQAKMKSEQDSQNLQTEISSSQATNSLKNINNPQQIAVNTSTLEQTKKSIEQKLGAIDEAQNRQFTEIRNQFAESINSVQSILNENEKLFERLDKVNVVIDEIRVQEQQKSLQMAQMGESINQLLEISRQEDIERAAKIAEEDSSWFNNPVALILMFTLPVLLVLCTLVYWVIKHKKNGVVKLAEDDENHFSLDPLTTEMDDLSDALSAELLREGGDELNDDNLFNVDDVLAEELVNSLDDSLKDGKDNSFIDDSKNVNNLGDDTFEEELRLVTEVEEQDDLDSLFDEDDDLSDEVQDSDDDFDLDDLLTKGDEQQAGKEVVEEESEEDGSLLVSVESDDETTTEAVVDDEDKPEINIDELFNESVDGFVKTPLEDDSDDVDEDVLQNFDKEIVSQNEVLDSVTDSLINELEQVEQTRSMKPEDAQFLSDAEKNGETEQVDEDKDLAESNQTQDEAEKPVDPDPLEYELEERVEEATDEEGNLAELEQTQVESEEPVDLDPLEDGSEELLESRPVDEEKDLAETESAQDKADESEPTDGVEEPAGLELSEDAAEELLESGSVEEKDLSKTELAQDEAQESADSEPTQDEAEESVESEPKDSVEEPADPEPLEDTAEELLKSDSLNEDEDEDLTYPDLDTPSSKDSTLDEDQLEKALEDFEKEELDEVLEDLTSNEPASINSLDELEFSADNFVTKVQSSEQASPTQPTLNDISDAESIDDFDDSELDSAFDEDFDKLDDLPGLEDWLDGDEEKPNDDQADDNKVKGMIEELDELSFDEMLKSIDLDNDILVAKEDDTGMDIAALLDETSQSEDIDADEEDFLDVDALLNESVDAESDDEINKALDLDVSLEPFVTEQDNLNMIDVDADEGLGAKLDLAHAYIEIGDEESAKELLDEIFKKGNLEQIAEAKIILDKLE